MAQSIDDCLVLVAILRLVMREKHLRQAAFESVANQFLIADAARRFPGRCAAIWLVAK